MAFQQDGKQPVLFPKIGFKFGVRRQAQEATVNTFVRYPFFNLRIIAEKQLIINLLI